MGAVKLSSFGPSFTSVFLGVEDHGLSSDPVISLGVVDLLHELLSVVSDLLEVLGVVGDLVISLGVVDLLLEVLGVVGDLLISLDIVDPLLKVLIIVGDFFSRVGFALSNVRLTGHPNICTNTHTVKKFAVEIIIWRNLILRS